MKVRVISALILSLCIMLSALAFPAYAADSHALETSVTSIMTAGTDGSLTVDEQWTINAFDGDVNEVSLCLALTGDTLLRDKSNLIPNRVSVNRLTIAEGDSQDPTNPTYTSSWTDNHLTITWQINIPMGEFAVLGFNYTIPDAVKSYNGSAWCEVALLSPPGDDFHFRNISISYILPAQISTDSFKVSDSGNLIVTKTTDGVTLTADNLVGNAGALMEMPLDLFDQTKLTIIGDTGMGKKAALVVLVCVFTAIAALVILYILKFRKIFFSYFEKRASDPYMPEVTSEEFNEFLKSQPPAQLLFSLLPEPTNQSDALAVTFLDLYKRGIIRKGKTGYVAADTPGLTAYEMNAVRLFTTDRSRIIADGRRLGLWINRFNNSVRRPGPFDIFIPSKRRLYTRLFAMKRAAQNFNYVSPGEISDSMLRENRFTMFHLFISLIRENKMRSDGFDITPKRKLGNDIFRLLRL